MTLPRKISSYLDLHEIKVKTDRKNVFAKERCVYFLSLVYCDAAQAEWHVNIF